MIRMPRTYVIIMVVFSLLLAGLLAAGLILPPSLAWGFHFLRFLPPVEIALCFGAIAIALTAALHPIGTRILEKVATRFEHAPIRFLAGTMAVFIGTAFCFRISVPLLGDSFYIIKHYADVSRGWTVLDPRNEPLATWFFYSLMSIFGRPGYQVLLDGFFYGELLLGCGFIFMGYVLVRNLFEDIFARLLSLLFLLTIPYMELFFGYIETYSLVLFMLMLYSMTAVLVLREKASFSLLALLVTLHILVHYLTFLLLPSFFYVMFQRFQKRQWLDVGLGLALMAGALVAVLAGVHGDIAMILPSTPDRHYLAVGVDTGFMEAISNPYTLFSRYHAIDLFNCLVLLGLPAILLMTSPAVDAFPPLRADSRKAFTFFIMAFCPIGLFLGLAKFDLGMARDWDVCAPYFLLLAIASVIFVFGRGIYPTTQRIATLIIMLSLIVSTLMFRVTGSHVPAIARYRSFFDGRNTSAYAWHNGSLNLAMYYHQTGDSRATVGVWEEYAAHFPSDDRAYKNLINAIELRTSAAPADVAPVYEHWIAARPTDLAARKDYSQLILDAGNDCYASGDLEEALATYQRGYQLDSLNPDLANNIGSILAQTGRPQDAIAYLLRAINLRPDYASAHYNLSNAYLETGERVAAHAHLRQAARLGSKEAMETLANDPEFADGRPMRPL